MEKTAFNPEHQNNNLSAKIVVGLERISEVFKVLLWDYAKEVQLSPIQIQMLLFLCYHNDQLNTVSQLAKEFNITKPTVSDAVKVLIHKNLVSKEVAPADNRSFILRVTASGKKIVAQTEQFANPIQQQLIGLDKNDVDVFYKVLNRLIFNLNKTGVLSVQRICFGCRFYEQNESQHFCNYLDTILANQDIRLDCPEFIEKA